MKTMVRMAHLDAPVFIHRPCLTVITWSGSEELEYGPLSDQGCDCESAGEWLRVFVEAEA